MNASPLLRHGRRRAGRTFVATTATLLLALQATEARGTDEKTTCVESYGNSQQLRRDHQLGRAREELRSCSRAACPALVRTDCIAWLDAVQAAFPSLAIRAVKDGGDIANVKVIDDNEVIAARLDGSSLEVEPGEHTFRFETDGAPPVVVKLVVREREKDRVVPVTFASSSGAPDAVAPAELPGSSRPVPPGVFVLGGVGVAGFATFGVLGLIGKNAESSLDNTCKPNCSQRAIDKVRTEYIVADVGLGVGAAALVSAGVWYFLRPRRIDEAPPSPSGVALVPARGGAALEWNGVF
jgi:hypothetical protein